MLERVWKRGNAPILLVGMWVVAATMENGMEVPQKTKPRGGSPDGSWVLQDSRRWLPLYYTPNKRFSQLRKVSPAAWRTDVCHQFTRVRGVCVCVRADSTCSLNWHHFCAAVNKSSKAGDNGMKLQLLYVVALIAPVLCQMPPMVALTPWCGLWL